MSDVQQSHPFTEDELGREMNDRMTLQGWERLRMFLFDLTDPDMYGFAVTDEVRRRALELLELFK